MNIEKIEKIIKNSNNIVFFGGAGTSTESNIPDFRTQGTGLYSEGGHEYPPEVMLSHSFFMDHTEEFFAFYKQKMIYENAKPNVAHLALAKLEEQNKVKAVITQNIDGLHQMAGSQEVLELHGSIHRNYCMDCHEYYSLNDILKNENRVPRCKKCGGIIKPDVVLYEEGLDTRVLQKSIDYIKKADVLIVGGTSLVVYPAAGLIEYYKGHQLVLINKSTTPYDHMADCVVNDSIGKVLGKILE